MKDITSRYNLMSRVKKNGGKNSASFSCKCIYELDNERRQSL